jgi:hypothetical protein
MRFASFLVLSVGAFAASPVRLPDTTPIRFEPLSQSRWVARGLGYSFSFTPNAAILRLGGRAVRLTFEGANRGGRLEGDGRLRTSSNYFVGSSYRGAPAFHRVRRAGAYPGIDVVFYGNGQQLEYDFEIAPGADPAKIRLRFDGADAVRLNERGQIVLSLGTGELVQLAPMVYQRRASGEIAGVESAYRIDDSGAIRLKLGGYNLDDQLVIDPVIAYNTYLAGSATDAARAIGHDSHGFIYLAGYTDSTDFVQAGDSYNISNSGNRDIWVMKLNLSAPPDQVVVYSTYLGGAADDDVKAMVVDSAGVVYLTGSTNSANFPVTAGALQSTVSANNHAYVTMLDPSQSGAAALVYSSYLAGGNFEEGDGIAVAGGKIYVTGFTTSDDFPLANPYQGGRVAGYDAFVVAIDPTQSGSASLVAGTYLGGSGQDLGRAIAVDSAGKVYVAGVTFSSDFAVTGNAYQGSYHGAGDAFLAELDLSTPNLIYSTYLGGSLTDEVKKIVIDPSGRAALTGYTLSPDFPVSQSALQPVFGGVSDAFLTILDLSLPSANALVYSTYYGGSDAEVAYDLRGDNAGKYYLGGYTLSRDLPVSANALNGSSAAGGVDGFVAVIDPSGPPFNVTYSSYVTGPGSQIVYGVDVDSSGVIYVTGMATGNIFPAGDSFHSTNPGNPDSFFFAIQR